MYHAPTGPLSIGGVLDSGFRLLKASFGKVFGLALIASLISAAPSIFMPLPATGVPEIAPGMLGGYLVAMAFSVVLYGAIIARINAVAETVEMSMLEAVQVGVRRFFPILFCFILYTIALLLGFVALVVPGIILMLTLLFAPYLVVTDDMGPVAALKQSHALVWGNWWRTAVIFTVVLFILLAAYILAGAITGVSVIAGDPSMGEFSLVAHLVMALISAVITPIGYVFGLAVMKDLELRKRGDDLEGRIEAIDGA